MKQEPPRGTGDAVRTRCAALGDEAQTLVLYGDVPLVSAGTLARARRGARTAASRC